MEAADLTLSDQLWIVFALGVTATLSMLAGVEIEKKEQAERERAREIENEAHKYATQGRRASRDITV